MTITDITESPEDKMRRFARIIIRIRELHRPFRIYDECDHADHDDDVVLIECDGFTTCADGYMYSVCTECCCTTDVGDWPPGQTEDCTAYHDHDDAKPRCATIAALDEPVAEVTTSA